jgi:hypothetical protein
MLLPGDTSVSQIALLVRPPAGCSFISTAEGIGMLTAIQIPPTLPPLPLRSDKTTQAAAEYLLTGDLDAWKHLIAILVRAKGNLFVPDPDMPLIKATRLFLELWLAARLAPYYNADADTIWAAAERGEFRYLGRQAKNALIDEIRRRTRSEDALDQRLTPDEYFAGHPLKVVSLDAPIGPPLDEDEDDLTLENFLAIHPSQDNPGVSKVPSALGTQPGLEPAVLLREIRDGEPAFKRLLGPLHNVLLAVCNLFATDADDLTKGDPAGAVAATWKIAVPTARRKLRQLAAIFNQAVRAGNPDVRGLYRTIATAGRPTCWVTGKPEAE